MELYFKSAIVTLAVVMIGFIIAISAVYGTMPDLSNLMGYQRKCKSRADKDPFGCGQTPSKLSQQMKMVFNEEYDRLYNETKTREANETPVVLQHYLKTHFLQMKPSIKLVPGKQVPRHKDALLDMVPIRRWKTDRELTNSGGFVRHGMRVQSGRIVIPTNGTYNIYSFTSLFVSVEQDKNTTDTEQHTIKHAIFKYNILDGEEVEIVSSVQPQKRSGNVHFNVYSSFITTVAHLKPGDELMMKLNNVTYMRFPEKTYFGANLV